MVPSRGQRQEKTALATSSPPLGDDFLGYADPEFRFTTLGATIVSPLTGASSMFASIVEAAFSALHTPCSGIAHNDNARRGGRALQNFRIDAVYFAFISMFAIPRAGTVIFSPQGIGFPFSPKRSVASVALGFRPRMASEVFAGWQVGL